MVADLLGDFAAAQSPIKRVVITFNLHDEPTEAVRTLASSLPWPVSFITNPKPLGFGANHNQAFAQAGLESQNGAFAVVNPDIRLVLGADGIPIDPFAPLLAALSQGQIGLAAPVVLGTSGQPDDAWRQTLTPWRLIKRYASRAPRRPEPSATAHWAAGMFWVCDASAWREVGGFDEGYFMYCEDMDLCLRMVDLGWKLAFVEGAQVIHAAQRASHSSGDHRRWHIQSLLRFWRKRGWRALLT